MALMVSYGVKLEDVGGFPNAITPSFLCQEPLLFPDMKPGKKQNQRRKEVSKKENLLLLKNNRSHELWQSLN